MSKYPIFFLTFSLFAIFSFSSPALASKEIIMYNDTHDTVHICYTYYHYNDRNGIFGSFKRECYVLEPQQKHPLSTYLGYSCPILRAKNTHYKKRIQVEGGPVLKVQSGNRYSVSSIRKGKWNTTPPWGHVVLFNDTNTTVEFVHQHHSNKTSFITLRPQCSRIIKLERMNLIKINQKQYAYHQLLRDKDVIRASNLKGIPSHCFEIVNDTEKTQTILHNYLNKDSGYQDMIRLTPHESKIIRCYDECEIQVKAHPRYRVRGGQKWSVSELVQCEDTK